MKERYLPIDLLRGATIILMIMVNMPGSWAHVYPPLRHSVWHGCTLADMVFPLFLFITGFSMAFSMAKVAAGESIPAEGRRAARRKILRRSLVIFAAGLFLNLFPFQTGLSGMRIMGVLQRIALSWACAAFLVLHLEKRYLAVLSIAALAAYHLASVLFAGPDPWSLEGSLAVRVDLAVLGERHMWNGFGVPFDPEGLITTFPATVSVLAGYLAGAPARGGMPPSTLVKRYLPAGIGLAAAGLALGHFQPVNKPLWTGTYVLLTTGAALVVMAACVWATEIRRWRRWASFAVVFGMNPLAAFFLSSLWARTLTGLVRVTSSGAEKSGYAWLYSTVFRPLFGAATGSFAFSVFHVIIFGILLSLLYRRDIVLKV